MSAASCASDASQAGVAALSAQIFGSPQKLYKVRCSHVLGVSFAGRAGHLTAWIFFVAE